MATDYEKIRQDNIKEYGEGIRHLEFLGRLYSEKTHFIYELLQNAEDARATKVSFILEPTRLIFKHNGKELLNEKHIRGICGVAEGTKAEDETKIGKFGIGFKSVYAYTRTPLIHCADEHFRIENYVRPFPEETVSVPPPWTTVFIFPFDKDGQSTAIDAFKDIGGRLAWLGSQTLLFLRNLREIEWEIKDGAKGCYQSDSKPHTDHRRVSLQCRSNLANPPSYTSESWLVFERKFNHQGVLTPFNVEAGFKIEKEKETEKEFIQRLTDSPLVVYFPTAIQTGFGFLIQGPYRTTPARDNIVEKNSLNTLILHQTGELVVQSLRTIKKLGMLTMDVLSALPLKQTLERQSSIMYGFRPALAREETLFEPITTRVAEALKSEELLPASPIGFASGMNALITRNSELRELLSQTQLELLLKASSPRKWVSGAITTESMSQLRNYLIHTIGVSELTPEIFAQNLDRTFLTAQTDEWFADFYKFLSGHKLLWRSSTATNQKPGVLRQDKPILRLENDNLVSAFKPDGHPNAFLPPVGETDFSTVKRVIAGNQKAKNFLIDDLELTVPDLVDEVIEKVLVKYVDNCTVTVEENMRDVVRIADAVKTDSQVKRKRLFNALQNATFLRSNDAEFGANFLKKPKEIYFRNTDLESYFDGNPNAYFLAKEYDNKFESLFCELGVAKEVKTTCRKTGPGGYVTIRDNPSDHKRGLNGFDPDFQIDGLGFALAHPTLQKSIFIWNNLVVPHAQHLHGDVESCTRKDFTFCDNRNSVFSEVGKMIFESHWLPDRNNQWHGPQGYSFSNLPEGFQESETVCRKLQMEFGSVTELAEKLGIPVSDLETLKNLRKNSPEVWERIKQTNGGAGAVSFKPKFPNRPVVNPERQDRKILERTSNPSDRTYETKERSVRTSKPDLDPKTWLANQYSNEEHQVICQMCESEMPFRKRDGSYYFEAVEAIPNLGIENHELFLALCPLCAAKYKELVKQDPTVLGAFKSGILATKDTVLISLPIEQLPKSIRFVETHLFDLQRILSPTT